MAVNGELVVDGGGEPARCPAGRCGAHDVCCTVAPVRVDELDTPVLTADLDAVERNIAGMQRYCDQHGLSPRPHVKTHKLPEVARLQVAAGAHGITCQKLGEAEIFVDAGFDDILVSFPLIGEAKVARLRALAERADVTVIVDSDEGAATLAGLDLPTLVECDTGGARTGVQTPADAARLAARVEQFRGFMTYPAPPGRGSGSARRSTSPAAPTA